MLIDSKQEIRMHSFKNTVWKDSSTKTIFNFNGDELELTERNRHLFFTRCRR